MLEFVCWSRAAVSPGKKWELRNFLEQEVQDKPGSWKPPPLLCTTSLVTPLSGCIRLHPWVGCSMWRAKGKQRERGYPPHWNLGGRVSRAFGMQLTKPRWGLGIPRRGDERPGMVSTTQNTHELSETPGKRSAASVGSGSVSQPGCAAPGFEFFQVAPFPDHSNGREKSS